MQEEPGAAASVAGALTPAAPAPGRALPSSEAGRAGGRGGWGRPSASPAAKTPPPSAAGRRLPGRQRASRECGGAGGGGAAGRTPPRADSPHSCRLTRRPGRRALQPRGSARPRLLPSRPLAAAAPAASPLAPPRSPEAFPTLGGLETAPRPAPLPLGFKPGGTAEGSPFLPERPPRSHHLPAAHPVSPQAPAEAPSPSWCPPPPSARSPGPRLRQRGCGSAGGEPPLRGRGRSPHLPPQPRPPPGSPPGAEGGTAGALGPTPHFPARTSPRPPFCASGPWSARWGSGALCNRQARLKGFPRRVRSASSLAQGRARSRSAPSTCGRDVKARRGKCRLRGREMPQRSELSLLYNALRQTLATLSGCRGSKKLSDLPPNS